MAANKGSFSSESGDYDYRVVQYKMFDHDRIYSGSGLTPGKAASMDLEWVRVEVTNDDKEKQIVSVYGPHLPDDILGNILEAMFDDPEYAEAF